LDQKVKSFVCHQQAEPAWSQPRHPTQSKTGKRIQGTKGNEKRKTLSCGVIDLLQEHQNNNTTIQTQAATEEERKRGKVGQPWWCRRRERD
jgi:hypothetical protein